MGRQTSLWLKDWLEKELDARSNSMSEVIHRDLGRLYTLYSRALPTVEFTPDEACLLVDVLNDVIVDANSARLLWAEVEDGINLEGMAEKWEVDGPTLVEKLQKLNETQAMALVDAAERFWHDCPQGDIREEVQKYFHVRQRK